MDVLGRSVRTIIAPGTISEITEDKGYDDAGRLAWVKDGNGNPTRYTYDEWGRAARTTYPDTSYTSAACYNNQGLPKFLFKRDGSFFELTYDSHGRILKRKVYKDNGSGNFTESTCSYTGYVLERTYDFGFDNMGRTIMSEVTKGASTNTITMEYDAIGRKAEEMGDDGYGATYAYDDEENEIEITYDDPGSDTYKITQIMNFRGQIAGLVEKRNSSPDKILASFSYDQMGRMTEHKTGADRVIT